MSGLFFDNDSGMFLPIAMATNLKSAIFTHLIVARSVWVALCVSEVPRCLNTFLFHWVNFLRVITIGSVIPALNKRRSTLILSLFKVSKFCSFRICSVGIRRSGIGASSFAAPINPLTANFYTIL